MTLTNDNNNKPFDWIQILNNNVKNIDKQVTNSGKPYPSVFIVGAPRSGTTLLSQLFASCTEIGYVSNIMALFWDAPILGAHVSEHFQDRPEFTGRSVYGKTSSPLEPHEFGMFWRTRLKYSGMDQQLYCNVELLRKLGNTLDEISKIFKKITVYKVFQLTWHMHTYQTLKPETKWIWIERDLIENASSILKLRETRNRNIEQWVSSRPHGVEPFLGNPFKEVLAQVILTNKWLAEKKSQMPAESVYHTHLSNLQRDPEALFSDICQFVGLKLNDIQLRQSLKHIETKTKNILYQTELTKIKDEMIDILDYV